MLSDIEIRAAAIERTIQDWKDREFSMPKNDCLKLFLHNQKLMGRSVRSSAKLIGYKNPLQARATLKRVYGVPSVEAFMNKFYKRITVAAALPSDVLLMPGEELSLGSIGLYAGNQLVFAYVEGFNTPQVGRLTYDEGMAPMAAWRAL